MLDADGRGPVLVVDDDPIIRSLLRHALEDEGLEVETVADGPAALRRAATRRPAMVVLDLSLPQLGGERVAEGVRALHGHQVPIVVITADGQATEKARRVQALSGFQKPFDLDALIAAVWRGLAPTH